LQAEKIEGEEATDLVVEPVKRRDPTLLAVNMANLSDEAKVVLDCALSSTNYLFPSA